MAVAFQSVQTAGINSSTASITVTKPTSLSVGDLMVAHVVVQDNVGGRSIDLKSGWTDSGEGEKTQSTGGSNRILARVMYKIADSGDTAASDFTFNVSGGNATRIGASVNRITGHNVNTIIDARGSVSQTDTATPSLSATITPTYADELYLGLVCCASAGSTATFSGYTLDVSNPSWTEDYDFADGTAMSIGGVHATRNQTTQFTTFNWTVDGGAGTTDSIGFLLLIRPTVDVTVSPSVITSTTTVLTPTISGGATVSPTTINSTATLHEPTIEEKAWRRQTKSAKSWTRTQKST